LPKDPAIPDASEEGQDKGNGNSIFGISPTGSAKSSSVSVQQFSQGANSVCEQQCKCRKRRRNCLSYIVKVLFFDTSKKKCYRKCKRKLKKVDFSYI